MAVSAGGGPRYWAYLSYSHADEAPAARLHRALEHYTLPAAVRRAHGLPKRLIPVFRDVLELEAAAGLGKRLEAALDDSRWLIVLCSPASAKSKYVNAEIEYFLKKHGPERILCALLDGEPPECFPPALRALADEPLAADVRSGSDFDLAVIKLIAAMAVIGFTELRNREAQRQQRRRVLAAAAVAACSLGAFAYWDLFHREHVDYYASYVRHDGIWQGLDRVSAETAARRSASLRFTRNGRLRPPRRVDYVNGSGYCLLEGMNGPLGHPRIKSFGFLHESYCSVEFDYREGGHVAAETWLNNSAQVLDRLSYTEEGLAQFTRQGFVSAEGGSGVLYVQSARDAAGLDRRVQFLHSLGNPRQNEKHEFGWLLEYDAAGHVIRRSVLDDRGEEIGAVTLYRYDPQGRLLEERQTDGKGRPQLNKHGYSSRLLDYNDAGNVVRERFFLPDGAPALASTSRVRSWYHLDFLPAGFAALAYTWDDRGNNIEWRQLDEHGRLVNNQHGFAAEAMAYDERGNLVRVVPLGTDLKPVPAVSDNTVTLVRKYGSENELIEERLLDRGDKPATWSDGASIRRLSYDRQQRPLKVCFFDGEGRPVLAQIGACYRYTLDARNLTVAMDYLDIDNRPYARPDSGAARTVIHRDDRGNRTGVSNFDATLKPVVNRRTGVASSEAIIDEHGNTVESRRYDTAHRLMRDKRGMAVSRAKFDRSGNRIEETYFDELQRPTRIKEGYYGYRAKFDNRGRMTRRDFLDARGGPLRLAPSNAYAVRYEYNHLGSVTLEDHLGIGDESIGRLEHRHDALGLEVEKTWSIAGAVAKHPATGCAIERFENDGYGRRVLERCLDIAERPVNRRDGGWAVKKIVPTISGVDEESYYDASGARVQPRNR